MYATLKWIHVAAVVLSASGFVVRCALAAAGRLPQRAFVRVAPHVVGGARFYVAERAYLRTDLRITVAGDQPSAQFRIGVGFDF